MKFPGWLCALLATACPTAMAATLQVDTFDSNIQSWIGAATGVSHIATGGAGDGMGYLSVPSGPNLAAYNGDARWSGSFTSIGAGKVVADLRVPEGQAELAMRVVLFGPDNTVQRYTSAVSQTIPADGIWREYTFSLASADLVPTQVYNPPLTHSAVMGNVLRVMLRHDPGTPSFGGENVSSELHIDNIELAAASVAGDFDGNGVVNGTDLTDPTLGWKQRFGTDLDGDDFLVWQRGLSVPIAAAVPEPASLVAMSVLAAALVRQASRRLTRDRV